MARALSQAASVRSAANGDLERNSLDIAKWVVVARFTGLLRTLAIGAVLGATWLGNIFHVANQLPWVLYDALLGSLLLSLLVPVFVKANSRGHDALERLAGHLLVLVAAVFAAFALIAAIATPLVGQLITRGVDPADRSHARNVAIVLLLLTVPQLVGYAVVAAATAIQNVRGVFGFPAAIAAIENVVLIGFVGLYAWVHVGDRTSVADLDTRGLLLLGGGSSLAVAVHAGLQLWGVHRCGVRLRPSLRYDGPEVRELFGLAGKSFGVGTLGGSRVLVLLLVAATIEGGAVAFQAGLAFVSVPLALVARPISTVMLKRLSELRDAASSVWYAEYRRSQLLNMALLIPAATALIVFAWPIARLVSVGALGDGGGPALVAAAIAAIAITAVGEGAVFVELQAAYARSNASAPLRAFMVRFALVVATAGSSMFFDGRMRLVWLLAVGGVADIAVSYVLHRQANAVDAAERQFPSFVRMAAVAIATLGPAALALTALPDSWVGTPAAAVALVVAALVAGAAYLVVERRSEPLKSVRLSGGEPC